MAMNQSSQKIISSRGARLLAETVPRKMNVPSLTFCEYFAGIGLVRLGLEIAGWEIRFANDFSSEKFNMYSGYFKDAENHYAVEDIFDLESENIPSSLLATASFPCIDLSLAGNLNGLDGKHSSAFWGFINLIKYQEKKPKLILLENVTGWLSSNEGKDFRLTIEALNQLGYSCDVYTINASHFVPQSRPRVFVIGTQITNPNRNITKLLRRDSSIASKRLKETVNVNNDLKWHIANVSNLPATTPRTLNDIVEQIEDTDDRWWSYDEVERHLAMMSPTNKNYLDKVQPLDEYTYKAMYRRMRKGEQRAEIRKDSIAGCLRTARGGSSRQMLVRAGQDSIAMRLMTPREYGRLQGVPDDYPIPQTVNQALTGFGDAVCVPVITWLAETILNPLALTVMGTQADQHEFPKAILHTS